MPYEFDQETGISHFLEHMCFRGTKRRSAYQITKEVDALGAQINAYTSKEFTCYFITVLPECLAEGADILFDIVFHSQPCMTILSRSPLLVKKSICMKIRRMKKSLMY